jgi:hypothetical protein
MEGERSKLPIRSHMWKHGGGIIKDKRKGIVTGSY